MSKKPKPFKGPQPESPALKKQGKKLAKLKAERKRLLMEIAKSRTAAVAVFPTTSQQQDMDLNGVGLGVANPLPPGSESVPIVGFDPMATEEAVRPAEAAPGGASGVTERSPGQGIDETDPSAQIQAFMTGLSPPNLAGPAAAAPSEAPEPMAAEGAQAGPSSAAPSAPPAPASDLGLNASERTELEQLRLQVATKASLLDRAQGGQRDSSQLMSKIINRPGTFDGTSARFHAWQNELEVYMAAIELADSKGAALAQSYLRGTALEWWVQKARRMEALKQPLPSTWKDFLPLLRERFEHRNPELAARERLSSIRQGSRSLHHYLKEFESLYAYLPEWSEADKIHRFVHGLQPSLKAKFCVDPATHQWWTSFDKLVAYISAFIADDVALVSPADLMTEILENQQPEQAFIRGGRRHRGPRGGRGSGGGRATLSHIHKGGRGQTALCKYQNGRNPADTVTRTKDIRSFCHHKNLCLCCFQPGHKVAECTQKPVSGSPEGYTPKSR